MKRNLLCLFLAFVMVLSCFAFTGCSEETEEEDTGKKDTSAMTLTLWLPTDDGTTEEAILAVEEAINKITKAKYDTAIELHAVPSSGYEAAIDARVAEIEANIEAEKEAQKQEKENAGTVTTDASESEVPVEEETYVNDLGITVVKYPEAGKNQMDIILVRGMAKYSSYITNALLQPLDSQLDSTNKVLKQYIYPAFFTGAKIMGAIYAIPNNHPVGEYKYLLVNKRLVEELHWSADELTKLTDCEQFILDVDKYTDVTPFAGTVASSGLYYWCQGGGWCMLASQQKIDGDTSFLYPHNILENPEVAKTIYLEKVLKEKNLIVEDPSSVEEFGVGIVSGTAADRAELEKDYYVYVYERPVASVADLTKAMFGVTTYTADLDRSMEIITAINTDPELRTVLQYGVEGVHWRKNMDNDAVIDILSEDYKMNLVETGNVYMTYPDAGVSKEYWDLMKQQNLDLADTTLFPAESGEYISDDSWLSFRMVEINSGKLKTRIDAMTATEFKANIGALREEINADEYFSQLISTESPFSVTTFYEKFLAQRAKNQK